MKNTRSLRLLSTFLLMVFLQVQAVLAQNKGDNSKNSPAYAGTYRGVTPCNGCDGIQTVLTLNKNQTFFLKINYLGKIKKNAESIGKFIWDEKTRIVFLDIPDATDEPVKFLVGENKVTQLDKNGKKITGAKADKYILTKETAGLTEKYWQLTELNGKAVQTMGNTGKEPHLIFKTQDAKVKGSGACNAFSGTYKLTPGNKISFSPLVSTRMSCQDLATESAFLKALDASDNYTVTEETLTLNKGKMAPLAKFKVVYFK